MPAAPGMGKVWELVSAAEVALIKGTPSWEVARRLQTMLTAELRRVRNF